ncbi:phosphotransferase [Bacillus sp. FJAT-27245]|uniref:phosphotransferase n=1 Tax=Bacillus sp. FJAT-27245 TaxID=1684144 RepID=UPI0006A7AD7C|nr:phosphotransferase [Bacillus sp. FJAT-27245]
MNIGEKLRIRRKKAGFTQEQVAEKINTTRQTLSNWEVGKNFPDIDSIIKLSQIYQLSLDELLLGKIFFKGAMAVGKKLSETEVQNLIQTQVPFAKKVRELHGGLVSQTFSYQTGTGHYVFQAGNRREVYEKERWVHNHYSPLLPLREVLEIQETENGVAYSISNYIEGSKLFDLNSQELLDICPSVMETLETLEAIEVPAEKGFGRFDHTGYAGFPTWEEYIKAVYNEKIYDWSALERNGLESDVVEMAINELKAYIHCISLSKNHLVHGDLGSFNLLAKDGRISGVIDWSLALYGDHLYDKANILFWNEDKLQPLVQRIRNSYLLSDESCEKVYCYMIRIGLEEIYNTVILNEIGYDIEWVANRLKDIIEQKH